LSANWKGGVTSNNHLIRASKNYAAWRTLVFTRDRYCCQKCGKVGGTLSAHHMDCFADFPEKRLDVDNGITLCAPCHRIFHRLYGVKHNRKWQADEFLGGESCAMDG
jgi:5-methylcytosine-specific restriction endonuclease McrA